jgi:hypothetical protein
VIRAQPATATITMASDLSLTPTSGTTITSSTSNGHGVTFTPADELLLSLTDTPSLLLLAKDMLRNDLSLVRSVLQSFALCLPLSHYNDDTIS